ncbi:MAG: hypothetical protein ACI81W_001731 [Saprospiraceae bacterium]|jgi:hypothetical protein
MIMRTPFDLDAKRSYRRSLILIPYLLKTNLKDIWSLTDFNIMLKWLVVFSNQLFVKPGIY